MTVHRLFHWNRWHVYPADGRWHAVFSMGQHWFGNYRSLPEIMDAIADIQARWVNR